MKEKKRFQSQYDHDEVEGFVCVGESATKQAFKDECDINVIMQRYQENGILPELVRGTPQYVDFADALTFQEAMNVVADSRSRFEALPSSIRDRFANDPAQFLAFVEDPKNGEELIDMGLALRREDVKPQVTTPAAEPAAPAAEKA